MKDSFIALNASQFSLTGLNKYIKLYYNACGWIKGMLTHTINIQMQKYRNDTLKK